MIIDEFEKQLFENKDEKYQVFQTRSVPNIPADSIIGVRTPILRQMAKEYAKRDDVDEFLSALPHKYFEENQIHFFIISLMKDYERCISYTEKFLPYINNWATCDQANMKTLAKHKDKLQEKISCWIKSGQTYTIRFAVGLLMSYYLDDESFSTEYLDMAAAVKSEEYYVRMMVAWYFATALAKQYESTLPYIESRRLDEWTHRKTIQKAIESYRITDEQKAYLRTLK